MGLRELWPYGGWLMKRLCTLALVTCTLFCPSGSLRASPIQSAGGVWGNAAVPGNSPAAISFVSGFFTNAQPPQPATNGIGTVTPAGSYTVSDLDIGLSPFPSDPGPVQILSNLTVTGTALGSDNGNTAVFSPVGGTGILSDGSGLATVLTATFQLQSSNLTGLDFGPSGGLFNFTLTTQGLTFTTGNPGTVSGNPQAASFNLQSVGVPEPGSLALWGVVGLTGVWYSRRRLKARAQATA
jgi:hypothetical protein